MGWWEVGEGFVIGDAAADFVEQLSEMGVVARDPSELSDLDRTCLEALYMDGLGRLPTDDGLRELLAFCA